MLLDEEAGIAAVTAIQLERLKFHEMASAQASAKKIEAGTSEDVINMLTGEAKDRISESLQEKREEAKERAEEKGKEEEKLEAQRTEKELMREQFELEQAESRDGSGPNRAAEKCKKTGRHPDGDRKELHRRGIHFFADTDRN